jgi:SAM-dependent methyltransferase
MKQIFKQIIQQTLPDSAHDWLRQQIQTYKHNPPLGKVNFGDLKRLKPISPNWGYDRGTPVDRYYVEQFLSAHSHEIRGRVMEIEDDNYTRRFGRARVTQADVLHLTEGNPYATIIGDLTRTEDFPADTFDCVILTQTLQFLLDLRAGIATLYKILKPGGVVLATFPGTTQICHYSPPQSPNYWTHDTENWSDYWYWNFTTLSASKLFEAAFDTGNVQVQSYGNVLSAIAALQGMALEELRPAELDYHDPDYQVVIAVRAEKKQSSEEASSE